MTFCQIDTTALSFYPLQPGNYWEYEELFIDWPIPMYSYSYYSLEVLGDTTLSNGLTYKIIIKKDIPNSSNPEYIFERIDSMTANVFRYETHFGYPNNEYLIDSLKSLIGDTSQAHRDIPEPNYPFITVCQDIYNDTLLGINTQFKLFWNMTYIYPLYEYCLAKSIGLSKISIVELTQYYCNLEYAEVNGETYGTALNLPPKEILSIEYKLYQNYPNPFNPTTQIDYYLPKSEEIEIKLYNVNGQNIKDLYVGKQSSGYHSQKLDGRNLASGIYYYVFKSSSFTDTKKCILVK